MSLKLTLFSFMLFLGIAFSVKGQVPQGFNYQAIARTPDGEILADQAMDVRLAVVTTITGGTVLWEEEHKVTTNQFGLLSIVLGSPTANRIDGKVDFFSEIDWLLPPLFLRTTIVYKGEPIVLGISPLMAVPYSMVSQDIAGSLKKLEVEGITSNMEESLFEVRNNFGQTVFAVYNEGVRIYVENGSKGSKGGFTVGSFGTKANGPEYLRVTHDSVRIYVNETAAKGSKGGFAVGGFSNAGKGSTSEFMFLTPENYFVGHGSGQNVTTGKYNSTLGYQSGALLQSGWNNIFIGKETGYSNAVGSSNVFIGNSSGYMNNGGNFNIMVGNRAGYANTTGWGNIVLGDNAGSANTQGTQNVIIGDLAGISNTTGSQNIFLGANSGYNNTLGYNNVIMGVNSGFQNTTGYNNVMIGSSAGSSNTLGYNNVFIGNETGRNNTSGNYNSFVGFEAGKNNTTGNYNTFYGYQAGLSSGGSGFITAIGYKAGAALSDWQAGTFLGYLAGTKSTGRQNTFLGAEAGQAFTTGADNVAVGAGAGSSNDSPTVIPATGSRNTFLGYYAGYKSAGATDNVLVGAQNPFSATHITGSYNVYLGVDAGNNTAGGSRNVFLGYQAGADETGSDRLYIHNNATSSPLIWGNFATKSLRFNGNTSINNPTNQYYALQIGLDADDTYGLVVWGPAYGTSAYQVSDSRLKRNVTPLGNALASILSLKGVTYDWARDEHPEMGLENKRQIGLIAQEVEKILPQVVAEGPGGYKSVEYNKITPVLIEAVKEQQQIIDNQNNEISRLKSELEEIKALLIRNGLK